jgi:hypothetical protein
MLAGAKFFVGPPMPDKSKGRGQMKCSPWSSRLGIGRGANESTPEKCTVLLSTQGKVKK